MEENILNEQVIKLNEKTLTLDEFNIQKEKISHQKGVQLVEIAENEFKTRLLS